MRTTLLLATLAALPALAQSAPAVAVPMPAPDPAPVTATAPPAPAVSPADNLPKFEDGAVYLFDGAKFVRMDKTPFAVTTRYVFVTLLLLMKVPGATSDTRLKNGTKPFILLSGSTKGGQLVHLTVDKAAKDPHRETRFVGEGVITSSDLVTYREEKLESGWHKIMPNINRPGEYAWVPFVGTNLQIVYDYGIDG